MDQITIVDFGSQYSQLIARRVRETGVYCEIVPPTVRASEIRARGAKGVILSGGPASVYEKGAPTCDPGLFDLGIPILGICYGMQLGCLNLGGAVKPSADREFGRTELVVRCADGLMSGVPRKSIVWMSHGDRVEAMTRDLEVLASSRNCPHAAVRHRSRPFYGVQFHPEVVHTPHGAKIIRNFLFKICRARAQWKMSSFVKLTVEEIGRKVGDRGVICALSGGVDSSVAAVLLHRAIGRRLVCVFVDNGLLRKGEAARVQDIFDRKFHLNLRCVDASARFLKALRGIVDPEKKRKIIGHVFIDVFKAEARRIKGVKFLAQGTLYPDVIESRSAFGGPSATIKTHHNVGGLPSQLGFKLIEPLKFLFKDEVRRVGSTLRIPDAIVYRQPFPGPGLGVRVLGEITKERLDVLREADAIITGEVEKAGLRRRLWQYFAVLLPVQTVGVMGDARTYENVVAIRAVESQDGMTADWARLPDPLLATVSSRIINEVRGVNRVVYDVSSKPPATIEWE